MWEFGFYAFVEMSKNLRAILLARTQHSNFEHKIYAKYLLGSGMESHLQLLGSSVKTSVP